MKYGRRRSSVLIAGEFARQPFGPRFKDGDSPVPLQGLPGWQSNGGSNRGDPARSLPFSLEIPTPPGQGRLIRVHLAGVFALLAGREHESPGTVGAVLVLGSESNPLLRLDLLNGRHYQDGENLTPIRRMVGDGASVETIGETDIHGRQVRVDVLTVDVPEGAATSSLKFKDLGSPASFVLFDVLFEFEEAAGCPFAGRSGGISLAEVGSIVRVGDRVRMFKALDQLEQAICSSADLDEARGQALTFIAVVTAATLELGGSREMHRVQLDAAREMERLTKPQEVARSARRFAEQIVGPLVEDSVTPSGYLIDRALALLNRNFAKDLNDAEVAAELGLSTSHFRYLFREATGQPFHRYLVGLRLERARQLLLEGDLPVSEVAAAVGFSGLAHFSRAFTQRFNVNPTNLRRGALAASGREEA